jgi:hypothetical protein
VRVQIHFLTHGLNPHPTRTESGSGVFFIFHPWCTLKPKSEKYEKNPKPEKPQKEQKNLKPEKI